MSVLFLDSSYDISLGLLSEDLSWRDFRTFKGQRASSTLQTETHRLLKDFHLKARDLSKLVTLAGPGFYTGLRLSEGFTDVTSFFGISRFSFYSYEVPELLGVSEGTWLTKAYRGEYFAYVWKEGENRRELLSVKDLESFRPTGEVFIHSESSLDEKLTPFTNDARKTIDLIRNSSQELFKKIIDQKLSRESFYFRAPEDEFRTSS